MARRPALIVGQFVWAAAVATMAVTDPPVAAIALGTSAYAATFSP